MAEHSEAPKNPQNPTEKSDSEYQPLWDMDQPAPEYSALLLHGTPVPAPTGDIPEPVKEVLEIQKARSASAPAVPSVPAAPDSAVPNPAAPILRRLLWRFLLLRRLRRLRTFSLRRRVTRC